MKKLSLFSSALLATGLLSASASAADTTASARIAIWPGAAPGSENSTQVEQETKMPWGDIVIRNVAKPTLEVFEPAAGTANGAAVIVCPGGAFRFLSIGSEGTQVAQWLASKGITAFLLRYRLAETSSSDIIFAGQIFGILAPLFGAGEALANDMKKYGPPGVADGRQSIKYVRENAAKWKLDQARIGILGFSAGGVVVTGDAISYDDASKPNFAVAVYPGPWPIDKVPADAPPLFAAAAVDDSITGRGYTPLVAAWKAANRPVDAHLYDKGGHGFGMKKQNKPSDAWTDDLLGWMDRQSLLKASASAAAGE